MFGDRGKSKIAARGAMTFISGSPLTPQSSLPISLVHLIAFFVRPFSQSNSLQHTSEPRPSCRAS